MRWSLLLALAACSPDVRVGGGYELVADTPTLPITAIDILFVVDDSSSMRQEQLVVADRFQAFIDDLEERTDVPLDLHIGVVSTNLGAGETSDPKCEGDGDGARLLGPPDGATCAGPDGAYIVHGETINYPEGQLADTFGCIALRGSGGCGFEQPLESMRRALDGSVPENGGFLRDDALLMVVFAIDEDDCSVFDTSLFDATQDSADSELGYLSSFRCFDFGVTCAEPDPRVAGPRTDCVPRDDSPYMTVVSDYADFLVDLKGGPGLVVLGGLFGQPGPVEVIWEEELEAFNLADLCEDDLYVIPAVRLHGLLDAMPRSTFTPLCDGAAYEYMSALSIDAALAVSAPECLMRDPLDTDDDDGVQATCRAFHVAGGARSELPRCDDSDEPCYAILADDRCTATDEHLAVQLHGVEPGAGERVQVECLALQ